MLDPKIISKIHFLSCKFEDKFLLVPQDRYLCSPQLPKFDNLLPNHCNMVLKGPMSWQSTCANQILFYVMCRLPCFSLSFSVEMIMPLEGINVGLNT